MTPSCGAHNAVMQHSNPKTAAEGGKSGLSAAQPGYTDPAGAGSAIDHEVDLWFPCMGHDETDAVQAEVRDRCRVVFQLDGAGKVFRVGHEGLLALGDRQPAVELEHQAVGRVEAGSRDRWPSSRARPRPSSAARCRSRGGRPLPRAAHRTARSRGAIPPAPRGHRRPCSSTRSPTAPAARGSPPGWGLGSRPARRGGRERRRWRR